MSKLFSHANWLECCQNYKKKNNYDSIVDIDLIDQYAYYDDHDDDHDYDDHLNYDDNSTYRSLLIDSDDLEYDYDNNELLELRFMREQLAVLRFQKQCIADNLIVLNDKKFAFNYIIENENQFEDSFDEYDINFSNNNKVFKINRKIQKPKRSKARKEFYHFGSWLKHDKSSSWKNYRSYQSKRYITEYIDNSEIEFKFIKAENKRIIKKFGKYINLLDTTDLYSEYTDIDYDFYGDWFYCYNIDHELTKQPGVEDLYSYSNPVAELDSYAEYDSDHFCDHHNYDYNYDQLEFNDNNWDDDENEFHYSYKSNRLENYDYDCDYDSDFDDYLSKYKIIEDNEITYERDNFEYLNKNSLESLPNRYYHKFDWIIINDEHLDFDEINLNCSCNNFVYKINRKKQKSYQIARPTKSWKKYRFKQMNCKFIATNHFQFIKCPLNFKGEIC